MRLRLSLRTLNERFVDNGISLAKMLSQRYGDIDVPWPAYALVVSYISWPYYISVYGSAVEKIGPFSFRFGATLR